MKSKRKNEWHQVLWFTAMLGILLLPGGLLAQKSYYTPKSLLLPLHDQGNQLHLSVGRAGGYDLHLSYAFTDKFAVFSTATFDNGTKKRISLFGDRFNIYRNDYVLRSGLGYFRKKEGLLFPILELYTGAGISKIDNYWHFVGSLSGDVTQAQYYSVFGQINMGGRLPNCTYGLGFRISYSQYTQVLFYDTSRPNDYINSRYDNLWGFNAEPAMHFSYNLLKGLQVSTQGGLSIPLGTSSVRQTNTSAMFRGSEVTIYEQVMDEKVQLWSLMARLGLQYNLNFGGR